MSEEKNSKQMSLLEDSHANRSVLQENKKAQTTTDISGQKCLDSLKKLNQNSLLGRMCKELLTSKTAWYSDRCKTNWKVKVSKSNVSLFQLQASVLGTKETESGLLDTQKQMDYSKQNINPTKIKNMKDVEKHLRSKKQSFPTPTSFDSNEIKNPRKPHSGGGQKPPLNQVVQMYPTPSASCMMDVVAPPETVTQNSSGWSVTRVGTGTKFGAKLNDVVNKVNQPIEPGGKLNPTFVEFLMGFPESWTNIEQTESKVSATPSSHKSQESSDSQSKKFYPTPRANEPGRTTKGYGRGLAELMEGKEQREPKKFYRTPTAMDKGDNSFKYAAKFLKGKTNRSKSKESVQKTLSMDVAMEHLKQNPELIELYDEKFKHRPNLPPKDIFLNYLKENLNKKELIAADIIKKTTIDHWLRSDHCFAYPTKEYWNMIKPYLKEVKFDKEMNYEEITDWE